VLAGARSPEQIRLTITNVGGDPEPLDFTTVTAIALLITRPDGSRVTWSTATESQTDTELVLVHVFDADGLEVDRAGAYGVAVDMTVPAGIRRTGPGVLHVQRV
jgi:hypothetical protein